MSTNKTPNLNLHAWEPTDAFSREEFNDNFDKIDDFAGATVQTLDARIKLLTDLTADADTTRLNVPISGWDKHMFVIVRMDSGGSSTGAFNVLVNNLSNGPTHIDRAGSSYIPGFSEGKWNYGFTALLFSGYGKHHVFGFTMSDNFYNCFYGRPIEELTTLSFAASNSAAPMPAGTRVRIWGVL